ncbi:MAG: hydantoinase B/oxoprolinase family protein [Thermoleophilaceae bacterium]
MSTAEAAPRVSDPVELALTSNRLRAVVRKMSNTLFRTGRSGVLNTARDFSCAIVTADHRLLMTADSLPIHVMSGPDLMSRSLAEFHPTLRRGDAFLHNSPYHGNSHAADHSLLAPIVDADGTHRFTVLVKAHQADCGNSQPTTYMSDAADVYNEGALIFPAVQIQRDYEDIADIVRMCEARIRVPSQWRGDYLGMLGAARIGERELGALGEELGWDALLGLCEQWFDYSEWRMASAIRALPGGEAHAESRHDPVPGVPDGIPIQADIRVEPEDASVEIDLRDNPDCVPCGLNLTESTARTAAYVGVFNSVGTSVPANHGSFRRIRVHLRENCVAGIPRHPASASVATTGVADRVTNCVQRAFASLGDGAGMAEAGALIPPAGGVISGRDPRTAKPFVNQIILTVTGGAGGPRSDGWLTLAHVGNGGMLMRDSVEVDELAYPIRIEATRLLTDTEGPGRRRGTPSAYVEYGPVDCVLHVAYGSDGTAQLARGARGGGDGPLAEQYRRKQDGSLEPLPAVGVPAIQPGETIVSISTGGAGYGDPFERDVELVAHDVRERWLTPDRAASVYGVAVDEKGVVDADATRKLRAR